MKIIESSFRIFLIFACFLISVAIFANESFACECYPTKTVNKALADADKVVILKLQSIDRNSGERVRYNFSVEKVFKGNVKIGDTLPFTVSSNCSMMFEETEIGTEFLFYLGVKPEEGKYWVGSVCSRSGRVKDRTADLLYLEKEPQLRGRTRLSGKFEKLVRIPGVMTVNNYESLPRRRLTITGNGKSTVLKTDENGVYEIYDLPPGKYRIKTEKLDGYKFDNDNALFVDVEITPKTQTEQSFFYMIDNAVSGTLTDQKGQPLKDISLGLYPVGIEKIYYPTAEVTTNKSGYFEFSSIPEGNYYLKINYAHQYPPIPLKNPYFDTFYYPSTRNQAEALAITIGADYFLRNLKIIPPNMTETVTLSGTLRFSDGYPVPHEFVYFLNDGETIESTKRKNLPGFDAETDAKGRFTLNIFKGQKGTLRGRLITYSGDYQDCPEIDKLLDNLKKETGDTVLEVDTAGLNIEATADQSAIELKLPFPKCQKKDQEK